MASPKVGAREGTLSGTVCVGELHFVTADVWRRYEGVFEAAVGRPSSYHPREAHFTT